jgi:hypothetical protein
VVKNGAEFYTCLAYLNSHQPQLVKSGNLVKSGINGDILVLIMGEYKVM